MITDSVRLPGVFFEAPTALREDTLPRMDIAAFAGFASTGPLHVPVPVESPRRFREIFGDDPPLAWDGERGQFRRAHLGGAVETFFLNGGVRCWVVRVADAASAVRHEFTLPALIAADRRFDTPPALAVARARGVGSWCEDLAVSTALARDPLPVASGTTGGVGLLPGRYFVDLVDRSRVQPGDLLEIAFGAGAPVLLLFVRRMTAIAGGVRVHGADTITSGQTTGAFWVQPVSFGSPGLGAAPHETTPPVPVTEAAGIAGALAAGSPPARPVVHRLSFELLVWKGTELLATLADLGFGSLHARFWGSLPLDEDLFALPSGPKPATEPAGLLREVSSPRFPLAGPGDGVADYYLPWGMGRMRGIEAALPLAAHATAPPSTPLQRNGLAEFATGLFVDPHLARVGAGALLGEAEQRYYVRGVPLTGIHSLLPIEEASLIAVPDAVHRGWSRELPPQVVPLGAPVLAPIPDADAAGRYALAWTPVPDADGYTLQRDIEPAFETAVTPFEGEETTATVALPAACPRELFFRVRAFREGEVGPWSNTRAARLPREDFTVCDDGRPSALVLEFLGDAVSPGSALAWHTEDPAAALPLQSEIQSSTDPGFATAVPYAPQDMTAGFAPLPERRFARQYYRVRGTANGIVGAWSNTVAVNATDREEFQEFSAEQYEDGFAAVLLAIHRALLRFAAARGDLLAVLALPDHYRTAEALEHNGRLTPGGPETDPPPVPSSPLFPRVAPLTEGEAFVLSYGALYHPWAFTRIGGLDTPIRLLPPDGAIAGVMASVAALDGAWRAPANRPLAGVVALQPPLGGTAWEPLVNGRVNLVLNDARGFLTKSEDTLGGERALGRIHVRLLMILLRRIALREGERFVFEPHGAQLQRRVRSIFEGVLSELFQRGAFQGADAETAFAVVTDESVNRPATVDRGQLIVELRVAPAAALAYLTVRLVTAGTARFAVEEV